MSRQGYVYFMSNRYRGVIYIGVTSNLIRRVWEHREGIAEGFTKKYHLKTLVYFECYDEISTAITYEKKLKNIGRFKKISIIERLNPEWKDLWPDICGTTPLLRHPVGCEATAQDLPKNTADPAHSLRSSQDDREKEEACL